MRKRARVRRSALDPSLECPVPDFPPAPEGAGTALMEFCPLRHAPARRIRSLPGVPRPGTFRPQGLTTLSTVSSPPHPAAARRPPRHPWGLPFRALLLPASGTPLGVSPLLSFLRAASAARPRLQRLSPAGKGTDEPPRKRGDRRSLPSWVFAPPRLSPLAPWAGFPARALLSLSSGGALYRSTPGLGSKGCCATESAGLSRGCRPSWGFAPFRNTAPLRSPPAPGSWIRLGPLAGLFETEGRSTGVRHWFASVR